MNLDPYSPPVDPFGPSSDAPAQVGSEVIGQLAATRPWVRFLSVISFIYSGFMAFAGLGGLTTGAAGMSKLASAQGATAAAPAVLIVVMAGFYLVFAIVSIFPGIKLWKYASKITLLERSGDNAQLVAALNEQRGFWRFVGILTVAMMVVGMLAFVGSIAVFMTSLPGMH